MIIKGKGLLISIILGLGIAGTAVWFGVIKPILGPPETKARYIYPRWQNEKGAVWTAIGRPGDADEAIVGPGGEVQPWNSSFSVSFWVYDRSTGALYAPDEMPADKLDWRLMDGYLPVVISTWKAGDITVEITNSAGTKTASRIILTNNGKEDRNLYLYAVVRPHGVAAKYSGIKSMRFFGGALYVNGRRAVEPLNLVYETGVSPLASNGIEGDISVFATRGRLPEQNEVKESATGAFRYEVSLKPGGRSVYGFVYASSSSPDAPLIVGKVTPDDLIDEAVSQWQFTLEKAMQMDIPDKRMRECFYASLAYLLVLKDGPYVVPGPLNYNSIWVRDAAYAVDALVKTGLVSQADETIKALIELRRHDGLMPPVFDMNLRPLPRFEWDSQGQLIHMIAQRYRLTGDKAALAAYYPAVAHSCRFIHETRKRNTIPELAGTPYYGLMPPSLSAEDIGKEHWHHYWDDFWCAHGLKRGAEMAAALGRGADAAWMNKEAAEIRSAVLRSVKLTSGNLNWIPNGPEDTKSSSAARGTTAGVWPTGLLSQAEAKTTFDAYWSKWVEPNKGGFMHNDKLWPYATLSLAHAYLWLGDNQKAHSMLKWTLENQTAPGVYAWSEVVDPNNMRFAGGDIPHGWGAAEYILLLRDMIIRDDGSHIVLLSGVPEEWLTGGKVVRIKNAPTLGGRIGFEAKGNLEKDRFEIKLTGATIPKSPIEVRLPVNKPGAAVIPGGKILPITKGSFTFPKGITSAVLMFGDSAPKPQTREQETGNREQKGTPKTEKTTKQNTHSTPVRNDPFAQKR